MFAKTRANLQKLAKTRRASAKNNTLQENGRSIMLIISAFARVTSRVTSRSGHNASARRDWLQVRAALQVCRSFCELLQVFLRVSVTFYFILRVRTRYGQTDAARAT